MRKKATGLIDVLIIGSGPAGIVCAITCKNHGLSTLLITDKSLDLKVKPPSKGIVPSESVHPGVNSLLERLSLKNAINASSKGVYEGIYNGDIYMPLSTVRAEIWTGYHINRAKFDNYLLYSAKEQNVIVRDSIKIKDLIINKERIIGVKTQTNEIIYSKYIIDATGFKRLTGKRLKFNERYFSPPLFSWSGISEGNFKPLFNPKYAYFIPERKGWTWIAMESSRRLTWTTLSTESCSKLKPPSILKDFKSSGGIYSGNRRWRIFRPLVKEGLILIGDAAGIIDPASGQGILNALLSGIEAGNTVAKSLSQPLLENIFLTQYDNWFFTSFVENTRKLRIYYKNNRIDIFDKEYIL